MIGKGVRKPSLDLAYKISNLFETTIEDIFLQTKTTNCFTNILSQERGIKFFLKLEMKLIAEKYLEREKR
ncbi:TPA: hypothetical protein ACOTGR_002249 [Clostridium perfringens]